MGVGSILLHRKIFLGSLYPSGSGSLPEAWEYLTSQVTYFRHEGDPGADPGLTGEVISLCWLGNDSVFPWMSFKRFPG